MRRCKMASVVFQCPLCCGESFSSRKSLREHLLSAKNSLCCPACLVKFEGISDLIDHLANDKCNATTTSEVHRKGRMKQIKLSGGVMVQPPTFQSSNNTNAHVEKVFIQEKNVGMEKVNLKIFNSKDPLSEEVRNRVTLLGDDNESHIIIVAEQSDSEDDSEDRGIIDGNQQNMVLTQENASPGTAEEGEDDVLSPEGDLYSCNSCSMSFTSVLEHIQKYHNNQEVVLEMTEDHKTEAIGNNDGKHFLLEGKNENINLNETEDILNKTIKYIITDSGEIVEADSEERRLQTVEKPRRGGKKPQPSLKEEACQDKDGRQYIRRIVQIDKFWNTEGSKAEPKNFANNDHKTITKTVSAGKVLVPQVGKALTLDVGPDSTADEQQTVFYQCASCNYPLTANDIKNHVCEQDPPIYACPQCPVTYTSSKSLCAHMKIHKDYKQDKKASSSLKSSGKSADANGTLFRCKVCDTIFPTNKSLRLHGRMHEPLRVRQVDGPVHYTSTGIKDENNDLLNTAASELTMDIDEAKNAGQDDHKDKYLCKLCDKWIHCGYKDIHDNYHESGNEFNCEICNRKFFTAENLMMHMSVHNTEKPQTYSAKKVLPYQCLYCNRQFSRPHEKVKHERIHTGEKPHSCDICGKSFRVSYCLTLHMRTHTGARPYVCGHCGKRFKAHSVYNHHLLTHSDVRAYKCCYCPKAFKTSVQLAGHKNSHTKPFSCTQCNRPFASLYAVRVHMETHQRQNNLKYRCALCGASYARAFALKDHVKSQHGCELFEISTKEIIVEEPSNDSPDLNNDEEVTKDEPEETAAALAILPKVENFIETEDTIIDQIVY